jgi:nitrate reductase NapE component
MNGKEFLKPTKRKTVYFVASSVFLLAVLVGGYFFISWQVDEMVKAKDFPSDVQPEEFREQVMDKTVTLLVGLGIVLVLVSYLMACLREKQIKKQGKSGLKGHSMKQNLNTLALLIVCVLPFIALDVLYGTFRYFGFVIGTVLFMLAWYYKKEEWSLCEY